ncbi:MAG TPA: PadR family transcriptional regulator [Actinomycetes bacterium]|nr:PadR family transcriptional regulator [Actinomycetes bacterium]
MSIKQGLLALLAEAPMYGAQLRSEFEARTGGTWPLNVGQVYTTLGRLERDGLVEEGPADAEGRITYRLTETGRAEAERWWVSPVDRDPAPRNELAIKLALAVTVPGVDVPRVVRTQRTATVRYLQDLTRLKRRTAKDDPARDLAWRLVLDNLVYAAEAEVRWLDHVEASLARASASTRGSARKASGGTPVGKARSAQ